jgi:polysaccharide deacetylase family protein (PEP-CTERM system associated)
MTMSDNLAQPGNMLSIDVEEWYHLNYSSMDTYHGRSLESRVRANTETLLNTLADYKAQATFFFLGSVAEQYPDLVCAAQTMGHEIASHGYGHQLVYSQSREEFRDDVKKSLDILQSITNHPVQGYRAPSWSISKDTPWAYEVLVKLGLTYNASLFPVTTYLYGDSTAPVAPFVRLVDGGKLVEVPASALKIGTLRIPFGGGFYFRAAPYWATRLLTYLTTQQGRAVVFYLHPREIDPEQPRLKLPARDRLVTYVGISGTLGKLRRLVSGGPTLSIRRYLELAQLT